MMDYLVYSQTIFEIAEICWNWESKGVRKAS